ncbi:hypothetical protein [Corynebacterium striatum]|uniref:hypothetical protein n=1 Tax=Corynebacterium striatum TaxID=43770 RepID=UPI001F194BF3|nr:hypothetical protein [Corynebacterium striatum]
MAPPQDLSEVIIAGVESEWNRASSARQTALTVARVGLVSLGLVFAVWAIVVVASASGLAVIGMKGRFRFPPIQNVPACLSKAQRYVSA